MDKNKAIQTLSIIAIVASLAISGYLILKPGNQSSSQSSDRVDLVKVVGGKQLIQMMVQSSGYDPNYFKVKALEPVRWEITSSGQPGCDSGLILSNILPQGSVYLNPNAGQVTVVEFTPQSAGRYQFSCSMGMARGFIDVVN